VEVLLGDLMEVVLQLEHLLIILEIPMDIVPWVVVEVLLIFVQMPIL
jgi:hypothetical protein